MGAELHCKLQRHAGRCDFVKCLVEGSGSEPSRSHDCMDISSVFSLAARWERSHQRQEGTPNQARVEYVWTVSAAPGKLACFLVVFLKEKMQGSQGFTCTKCSVTAEAEQPSGSSHLSAAPMVSPRCVGRGRLT